MIHTFSLLGHFFIVDTHSGAVHMCDETAFQILRETEPPLTKACPPHIRQKTPDAAEVWDELYSLQEQGLLFSQPADILPALAAHLPLKALCLHVAHDCNLRCEYCFASTGDFGMSRKIMPPEVAQKALDFLVERSGPRKNLEVDFFGGEPLMAFATVRETVAYARKIEAAAGKKFRFTLTTNGLGLDDDKIRFLNEEMDNVVLSLDGRPEVHDRVRKTVNGEGSYALVTPRFQALADARGDKSYYVRGTFTAHNPRFEADVWHLASLGFAHLSLEPAVLAPGHPLALTDQQLPEVLSAYEALASSLWKQSGKIHFFHFDVDLKQGPCIYKRLRGCGAGVEYAAVTPEGDLYPCHQFVGLPEYRQGSVLTGAWDETLAARFSALNVDTRPACRDCWAKFYCSGGCSASNLTVTGQIEQPFASGCALMRKRLECGIALRCLESLRGDKNVMA